MTLSTEHTNKCRLRFLHNSPSFESREPGQVRQYLQTILRPHSFEVSPRVNDNLHFLHRSITLAECEFNALRYNSPAAVEAPAADDAYLMIFGINGKGKFSHGHREMYFDRGTVAIFNPQLAMTVDMSNDFEQLVIKLPGDTIKKALTEANICMQRSPLLFDPQVYDVQSNASAVWRLTWHILGELTKDGLCYQDKLIAGHLEKSLVASILRLFPHNYTNVLLGDRGTLSPFYIKRAKEFMHENLSESITLTEIAEAAGVSTRSLQNSFKHFCQMSPTNYLREIRLQRAFEIIKRQGSDAVITEIATACGFSHMGLFAKYYREKFGETPSYTKQSYS